HKPIRCSLSVVCDRSSRPADGGPFFSRVQTVSRIAGGFEITHAICFGGVRGAESGLVFSCARERLSYAGEQASSFRVHERARSAVYRFADACCEHGFPKRTAKLEIFYG